MKSRSHSFSFVCVWFSVTCASTNIREKDCIHMTYYDKGTMADEYCYHLCAPGGGQRSECQKLCPDYIICQDNSRNLSLQQNSKKPQNSNSDFGLLHVLLGVACYLSFVNTLSFFILVIGGMQNSRRSNFGTKNTYMDRIESDTKQPFIPM